MIAVAGDLPVGEADADASGQQMRVIALGVPALLSGRAVIAQPVGLDYETDLRPDEIAAMAPETHLASRLRDPADRDQSRELRLELGLREQEEVALEQTAQDRDPGYGTDPREPREDLSSACTRSSASAMVTVRSSAAEVRVGARSMRVSTGVVRASRSLRACIRSGLGLRSWTQMPDRLTRLPSGTERWIAPGSRSRMPQSSAAVR